MEALHARTLLSDVVGSGILGVTASIRYPGGHTEHFAAGVADLDTGRVMAPNSYVRIASVTKLFTATAVLRLMVDGRIELDKPAGRYLPAEFAPHVDAVTVRQLLNHTSGLTEPELLLFPSIREGSLDSVVRHSTRSLSPESLTRIGLQNPPAFAPGAQYWYSNTNYHLLGLILETITGRSAYDVIESQVVAPAELASTYFPRGTAPLPQPSSVGYDSLYQLMEPAVAITDYDMSCMYTAGALVSTPHDLNQFAARLLDGRVLPPEAVHEMTTMIPLDESVEVGLGLQRVTSPAGTFLASEGVFFGTQTVLMATPDGAGSWVMNVNTTKYQHLGPDGWPLPHPADTAIAALGSHLSELITERR